MYEARQNKEKVSRTLSFSSRNGFQLFDVKKNSRIPNLIQRVLYVRGIENAEQLKKDKERLVEEPNSNFDLKKDDFQYNLDTYLSDALGGAIFSVSRYNEGQRKYFRPTGYIIDIDNPNEDVLGNYKGDGNTSNPNLLALKNWVKNSNKTILQICNNLTDNINKENIKEILRQYFSEKFTDPLGPGNPDSLKEAEQEILKANNQIIKFKESSREIKYTESVIHLKGFDNILGAYYNDNEDPTGEWRQLAEYYNTHLNKSDLYMINEKGVLKKDLLLKPNEREEMRSKMLDEYNVESLKYILSLDVGSI